MTAGRAVSMVLLIVALSLAGCGEPAWRGTAVQPPKDVPAFTLTTADGTPLRTTGADGAPTFVFFGYTHCPDVCPGTLADWARVRRALGSKGERVRFLFVSIDPERDSAAVLREYVGRFDAQIIGARGDSATLEAMQQAFGAASYRDGATGNGAYLMAHSPQTFLLDGAGRLVAIYSFGSGWDAMAHDVERLL